ncbi:MAG: L-seryl-tRNA(Sec) selenium transferase [Actinomycetota bacterium]|nr:L-seryl-tRNA(Sec) selenium transferase [Actinomycetota bacterium]
MDLRDLPSVDVLAGELSADFDLPRSVIVSVARESIDEARDSVRSGSPADPTSIATRRLLALSSARLRFVVNATGVLLHTNLGRAPIDDTSTPFFSNLEFDLESGERGRRASYLHTLIASTVGADAALVVNNNAGALLLALAALAGRDGRVAVSRGELIEIGGSFRLPDLMAASGAHLVEVGTTNRTRESDFIKAPGTIEAVLKVHPSNYRVEGFTEDVPFSKMAGVAHELDAPFIADIGSGLLDESTPWIEGGPPDWLADEPAARQILEQGADVVLFSGDKLLGGPQAGVVVGGSSAIARMARHPVARAVRINTATISSLTTTFEAYASGRAAAIPFWKMATAPAEELRRRTADVLSISGAIGSIVDGESLPGAGSVPGLTIPTPVLRIAGDEERAWRMLADHEPPVVAARRDGATIVNLRSVTPDQDPVVAAALARL